MRTKIFTAGVGALAMMAAVQPLAAADMPAKAPILKAPPAVYNWTGFYVGANVGFSWGRAKTDLVGTEQVQVFRTAGANLVLDTGAVPIAGFSDRSNANGWLGGVQAGYNWQTGRWLFGIEADFQGTGEDSDFLHTFVIPPVLVQGVQTPATTVSVAGETKLKWFGTVRGRLGWLPTERILLYATGGLAYGRIESDYVFGLSSDGTATVNNSHTKAGYVVGGGIEGALWWDNWTVKAEYLYMDLRRFNTGGISATANLLNTPQQGFNTVTTLNASANTRFTDNIFRIGLNYHFAPGAVVARY